MARSHSRRNTTTRDSAITRSGSFLHWLGMLAMVIGLFSPLVTADAFATVMTPEQAMMKAAQQPFDRDTVDFERVVLVGDFQQNLGCGAWDTNCDQTRLVNVNGFWTGVFNVPPGTWSWELVAVDRLGNQYAVDDNQVTVSDGQAGIYAQFDSASRDSNVSAVNSVAFANGSFGDIALAQNGDGFEAPALNISTPGWVDMNVTVDGVPTFTGGDFQQGVSRVQFDAAGNIVNIEHRGFAEVTVQRVDADGNPLPGSCFVLEGSSESRGCDTDGSQGGTGDGVTTLRFPAGFQPGTYTLIETRAADGAEQLDDQNVDLQQGQTTIEARSEGEPTPETGDLVVVRQDEFGNPVAGACFELRNGNGEVVGSVCDADDGSNDGRTGFSGVPEGDYTLSETTTPEEVEAAGDTFVSVLPNQTTEQVVQTTSIAEVTTEEPTETVVEEPTEEVVDEPTQDEPEDGPDAPAGDVPGDITDVATETPLSRVVIFRSDESGNPVGGSCFAVVDNSGQVVRESCDEDGPVADDGWVDIEQVPHGQYTLQETRVPVGYERAADTPVNVVEGDNVTYISSPPSSVPDVPTEEATEEVTEEVTDPAGGVELVVTYDHDPSQPEVCVELESQAAIGGMEIPYACDNGTNDQDPAWGSIRMQSLPTGEYDLVVYQGPEPLVQAETQPVTLQEGQVAQVSLQSDEPETTSFTVRTVDPQGTAVAGACYDLAGTGETRCDEGAGVTFPDVSPGEHTVAMNTAPAGYRLADPSSQTLVVAADGTTTFTFQVFPVTASLSVQTVNENETAISGACYILESSGETRCDEGAGVTFENLTPGDYTVTMTSAPANYALDVESSRQVTVTNEGGSVTFQVLPGTANLTISTVDDTDIPVAGACYILDEQGEPRCDEGSGVTFENVSLGDHAVRMTSAPDGYSVFGSDTQGVAVGSEGATVTFTVVLNTVDITINTIDEQTGNLVAGACYSLDGGEVVCDEENSGGVVFENQAPGDKTLSMETAPEGYELAPVQTIPAEETNVQVPLQQATGSITVNVTDGTTAVTGACVALDDNDPVCDADDDNDGSFTFATVAVGPHTVTISNIPDGFDPLPEGDETRAVEVAANETSTVTFALAATQPETGTINVTVVDINNVPVIGACVALDDPADALCSEEPDGVISFTEVEPGEHTIHFVSAPSGLVLVDEDATSQTVNLELGAEEPVQVTFTVQEPPPALGDLDVTVRMGAEGEPVVPNACVIVTLAGATEGTTACDDNGDGVVNFTGLETGSYGVTLDLDQYTGPEIIVDPLPEASATVEAGTDAPSTATLYLTPAPTTGSLQITTTAGGINLPGACFTVAGNEICDNQGGDTDNTPGVVLITGLEPTDSLTVSMTGVPEGYEDPVDQTVEIVAGQITEITFTPSAVQLPGTITVTTVDDDNQPLTGACYQVRQGSTVVQTQCDAEPADGTVVFENRPAGNYTVVQTRTPSGPFQTPAPEAVVLAAGGSEEIVVTMSMQPGSLRIQTVDAQDRAIVLQNACYSLVSEGGTTFGPFCDADDANVDGWVRFTNLPAGNYELRQTVATPGYETAANRSITIRSGVNTQITVANDRIQPPAESGTLVVIPIAPNGEAVPGGCYQVFDGTTPVTNRVCDNADDQPAQITFQNVPVGELTLREMLAPSPDWQIAADITVTIRNGETTRVEVPHQYKPGNVVIQAVNSVGLPLQGACFNLTNAGDTELCTNSSGQATVSGLTPGSRELTQVRAPFGYKLNETPREVIVHPGRTTTVRIVFEHQPPPNTGTVQVQKFYCPAGEDGERTRFLGGAQGNQELRQTAGCTPGVATFTLVAENGSTESNAEFRTNREGRAQLTAVEGIYLLTETDPDMPGNSAARLRVGTGQMTTVIVINYVAPPAPAPVTINVEGYTCPPGFAGSSFVDFQNSCMAQSQLTNQITVRAEAANRYKRTTGDTGTLGKTAFTQLPAGTYSIWAERPHNMPLTYLFCGADVNNPSLKSVNGSVRVSLESGSTILCRVFQVPPLFDADHGAIQVHKFNCPINERQRGYDYQNECERPTEPIAFEIIQLAKTDGSQPQPVRLSTNADGIVQFPMLVPGTYKLTEVGGEWCFAQSNSVDAQGNVVVQKNKLSEVWVYNCVGTKAPPNTGSGDAADMLTPGGGISPVQVLPNLLWPTMLLAGWLVWRERKHA